MKRMTLMTLLGLILLSSSLNCGGSRETADEGKVLTVFHAGSLSVPLREVSELFMKEHPGVTVRAEAAGSRDSARKISDLGRSCDIIASADYNVIAELLMPEHADFNILFASNEMVIAHPRGCIACPK